jgi:hypothetical protein
MMGTYVGEHRWSGLGQHCLLLAAALTMVAALLLGVAGLAQAASDQEVISSAGPMSQIYINDDLGCQVQMAGDVNPSFFGGDDPGGCGTYMQINAIDAAAANDATELIGPPVSQGYAGGGVQGVPDFTPLGQTTAGSGTTASPYTVTTTVAACALATGTGQAAGSCPAKDVEIATLTETDTYVVGSSEYNTTLVVDNEYDAAISGTLYHTGDCFLGVDSGYGALGAGNAPECTLTPNNSPPGRMESFVPSAGPTGAQFGYEEGLYPNFWEGITSSGALYPDSVEATADEDNGMGLSWQYSLAVGGSTTIGYSTVVDPAPPTATINAPKVLGPEQVSLSGTVDPDGLPATVSFEYGLDPKYGVTTTASLYVEQTPGVAVGAGLASVPVTAKLKGLVPHALYHVRVIATSADGATTSTDRTFTTPKNPPPPPPVLGKEANFAPVSGMVYVKFPGSIHGAVRTDAATIKGQGFIPLTDARQLPVGTEVDARAGKLKLTDSTTKKTKHKAALTQSGLFYGGLFAMSQSKSTRLNGVTTLRMLDNGAFPGAPSYSVCTVGASSSHAIAVIAKKKPLSSKVLQTLGENEHGNFQTKGKYSAATVRGTKFSVSDRCGGTLTHVYHGLVTVTVYRTHKKHNLHSGQSFYAKAP